MRSLYNLGKLLLVISLVFQSYNDLLDLDHQFTFRQNIVNLSNSIPDLVPYLKYVDNIRIGLCAAKLFSSVLVFSNNKFIAYYFNLWDGLTANFMFGIFIIFGFWWSTNFYFMYLYESYNHRIYFPCNFTFKPPSTRY